MSDSLIALRDGYPGSIDIVTSFLFLNDGRLLATTDGAGALVFDLADLNIDQELRSPLPGRVFSAYQASDGNVWFATMDGGIRWRPATEGPVVPKPPTLSAVRRLSSIVFDLTAIDPITEILWTELAADGQTFDTQFLTVEQGENVPAPVSVSYELATLPVPGTFRFSVRGFRIVRGDSIFAPEQSLSNDHH